MKTLVVYFSRKGYVKRIAEREAALYNADIFEIKAKERTEGILGFWWCGRFGMHRWEMIIEGVPDNISQYDKLIICSPIWVFTVSAPVRAFLRMAHGRVKAADYVLVHFSSPKRYVKTVETMDSLLGVRHGKYRSISCVWGKSVSEKVIYNRKTAYEKSF